jgi:hypothetical protein
VTLDDYKAEIRNQTAEAVKYRALARLANNSHLRLARRNKAMYAANRALRASMIVELTEQLRISVEDAEVIVAEGIDI